MVAIAFKALDQWFSTFMFSGPILIGVGGRGPHANTKLQRNQTHTQSKIRNVLFFPFSTVQCEPWGCTLFTKSSDLGCKSDS